MVSMIHIALCKEVFSDIGAVPKFLEKKNDVLQSSQGNHTYLIPTVNLVIIFFMAVFEPKQTSQNIYSWNKSR